MAFKCNGQFEKLTLCILISIAKVSISFSKVELLNILEGICSLTYNMPPPFPVQSNLNGTEYPGTQN